jgi:hypothetical protein
VSHTAGIAIGYADPQAENVDATLTMTVRVKPDELRSWQQLFAEELQDDAVVLLVDRAVRSVLD